MTRGKYLPCSGRGSSSPLRSGAPRFSSGLWEFSKAWSLKCAVVSPPFLLSPTFIFSPGSFLLGLGVAALIERAAAEPFVKELLELVTDILVRE